MLSGQTVIHRDERIGARKNYLDATERIRTAKLGKGKRETEYRSPNKKKNEME